MPENGIHENKKTDDHLIVRFVLALPIFPARLQASIVGRNELNFRVRNGNGWTLILINTKYVAVVLSTVDIILAICDLSSTFLKFFQKSLVTRTGIEPMFAA